VKVWIDMANSPHPLLFAPLVPRLRERGAEVLVTYRDHAQTAELTLQRWPEAELVGGAGPDRPGAKAGSLLGRARALSRWAASRRPDVALSHNSYAQLLAARARRLPAVTAMDFEHQPANHLAFRAARRIIVPEALPERELRRQGARRSKLVRYDGLKEELYLGDFEPDQAVASRLGFERDGATVIAVARSAPAGAAYHRDENPMFEAAIRELDRQPHVRCVILARHPEQRRALRALDLERTVVPERAIDSRSLLCEADLFVGAGGTMTREAALLGVPTWSMFAGRRAAVDLWLESQGKIQWLESAEQLRGARARERDTGLSELRRRGEGIAELFVDEVIGQAAARPVAGS
jgi:predicted glycosyltransferase